VRVVLFANEENGLKGAYAYADAHKAELPKHQAAMEFDAGAGEAWRFYWSAGDAARTDVERIAVALAPLGIENAVREDDAGGADLIPLADAVPKFSLKQDARRYFDLHHSADDTCDKIVPEEIAQVVAAGHLVIRDLADTAPFLPRPPPPKKEEGH
jgi:hypothetical protein